MPVAFRAPVSTRPVTKAPSGESKTGSILLSGNWGTQAGDGKTFIERKIGKKLLCAQTTASKCLGAEVAVSCSWETASVRNKYFGTKGLRTEQVQCLDERGSLALRRLVGAAFSWPSSGFTRESSIAVHCKRSFGKQAEKQKECVDALGRDARL